MESSEEQRQSVVSVSGPRGAVGPQRFAARRRLLSGRNGNIGDRAFRSITALLAGASVAVLALIAGELTFASKESLVRFGPRFLFERTWDPVREVFGALPFVYGTLVSSLLALVLAVPVSLGIAVFLTELAPTWLRRPTAFVIELLAAVPSVIYGLWGVFVLTPWLRDKVQPGLQGALGFLPFFEGPALGFGMLAGALILAIMILPTISSISREVLHAIPNTLREGSLALGATRWETLRTVILPFARSGILGAVILGLGRALGETMAVTMVIGNRPEISASLFAPSYTMASVLANEYAEATTEHHSAALTEIALLLFGVTVVLNIMARLLVWRFRRVVGSSRAT